jgi:glucose/arabinose dehydrogenase
MKNHRAWPLRGLMIGLVAGCLLQAAPARSLSLDRIQLPPGFTISVFAHHVPDAREMALGTNGTLFVGSRSGKVYAIRLHNGHPGSPVTVASGLEMPVGVAFRNGALYVSAVSRILRFDDIENRLDHPPQPVVVSDRFPTATHHGWKFIAFGPDGKLYVPVGAPCNICKPDPDRYANIMRMNADGSGLEVFARGIRNSVGFDWDPRTHELWFTSNGRDNLGDDVPSDELDHAPRPGMNFGYPYCHAGDIPDPQFGKERACSEFTPPALKLGAHVAPLGMRFYTGTLFPSAYRDNIFVAEHGSWNRSTPVGYRVMRVVVTNNRVTDYQPFATGWLQGSVAWGRPADVLVMPDGALLVSDDYNGVIYRIAYDSASQ